VQTSTESNVVQFPLTSGDKQLLKTLEGAAKTLRTNPGPEHAEALKALNRAIEQLRSAQKTSAKPGAQQYRVEAVPGTPLQRYTLKDAHARYVGEINSSQAQGPRQAQLNNVEAALKKVRQKPNDQQSLEALERAVTALKSTTEPAGATISVLVRTVNGKPDYRVQGKSVPVERLSVELKDLVKTGTTTISLEFEANAPHDAVAKVTEAAKLAGVNVVHVVGKADYRMFLR
jgi:hypothetical protein